MATITRSLTDGPVPRKPAKERLVRECETINVPPKAARVAPKFVILNKNFGNYVMARDRRTVGIWRRGVRTRRWRGHLIGDNKITFHLPADVEPQLRRYPTGFDTNVLFLLLAEAKKQNRNKIEIPSRAYILRALGFGVDYKNLKRLNEALAFWSVLSITFNNWYSSTYNRINKIKTYQGENSASRLPPPIQSFSLDQGVKMTLSQRWLVELHQNFWVKVPLPLPSDAAAQNLILCLLVTMKKDGDVYVSKRRRVRQLCRKIGLNHTTRNQSLQRAIESMQDYFKRNHLRQLSEYIIQDGKILFLFKRAKRRPKLKAKKPKVKTSLRQEVIDQPADRPRIIKRPKIIDDDVNLNNPNVLPIITKAERDRAYQLGGRMGNWVMDDA